MSQDHQPIPSRRELRRAREARQALLQEAASGQEHSPSRDGASPRKPDQVRKPEQAEKKPGQKSDPIQKQDRLRKPEPGQRQENTQADATPAERVGRTADASADSVPTPGHAERTSQIRTSQLRARDRAALRAIKELEQKEDQLAGNGPPSRRQLRLQKLREEVAPPTSRVPIVDGGGGRATGAETGSGPSGQPARETSRGPHAGGGQAGSEQQAAGQAPAGMTVEQALAARELIAAQARNQLAKMEHIASQDPEAVDPKILAEQIAIAERAAVLNKRAQAKQKLADQSSRPEAGKPGPSTASNLAMVTPLEFVKVPGVDRPVMKPPSTSFVPVTTNPAPKVVDGKGKGSRKSGKAARSGRAGVLARAEAVAKAASQPRLSQSVDASEAISVGEEAVEVPRVSASAAYGLEPLDAATAGLGRAKRQRLVQAAILATGIIALVAGIAMIISGLSH